MAKKELTEEQQDKEILRVIKAIGFPISARALHEIFADVNSIRVNQAVWRHMGREVDLDVEMRIFWKK